MDNPNSNTEHRKGQQLTAEERHDIEVHLKDGWSKHKIAKHLNRPYNTIKNEITRGTVALYHGKVFHYKADAGQQQYLKNRRSSARKYRYPETTGFLKYVVKQFREQGWSLDACVGNAMLTGQFSRKEMVCTKTLYKYVDLRLLPIRNIDLPEKLRRNTKARKVRENRKNLGKSIFTHPFSQAIVKLSLYHSNSFLRWLCRLKNSTLASKASPRADQTSAASAISASLSIVKRSFTID